MMKLRFAVCLVVLSLNAQFSWAQLDNSDLNSLISDSEKLLKNAAEGNEEGQYLIGSKEAFRQVIDSAVTTGAACTSVLQLDSVTDILHNAYLAFLKKRYGIQRPLVSDNYWEIATNTTRWGTHNLHDPSVIKTKGYFYVYGTDAAWGQTIKGIPYRRSRDLVNWEYLGTVFNGSYPAVCNQWMDSLSNEPGHTQTGIWAPYIMRVGNEYRLYYCSIHSPNGAVICLAVSQDPRGPWIQRGPLVYYKDGGSMKTNAIDPTVTIGQDGRFWMAWGSWSQGIFMTELDPSTGLKKAGATETCIARNRGTSWSTMEGPEIIYNPAFKKYYLFVAEGDLGTIYQTRVARSSNPNGPYLDINNNTVVYTQYKDVYPLLSYAYQFGNHPGWQGVSHCGVINVNGQFFMLNQGRPSAVSSMMDLHVKKIYWTKDGWPVISPERYADPGIMPTITPELIAGTWEEIQLNEIKSGGVSNDLPSDAIKADPSLFLCKPSTLVFSSGGAISPSGTWSFDGSYLTIVKGGYTYNVTVDWEWDWENGCSTLIYTGLRSDGHSVWGKKSLYLEQKDKNMVENSTFDDNLKGYVRTAASGNTTVSITDSSSGALNYISGHTFSAVINTLATNYYDQALSWRFPAQQGSRYKVSFKYRVSAPTPIHVELQETAKDFTALYRQELALSDAGTIDFITNDVSLTDPYYTLNIQYGTSTQGVRLLLDNISIKDITHQWNGNYLVNGNFEYGLDSWSKSFILNSITGNLVDTATLEGNQSFRFTNSYSGTVSRFTNRLYWKAYLPGGYKYRVEFDIKGTGTVDATFRSATAASTIPDIAGLYAVPATGQTQTLGFDIPVLPSNGDYSVSFCPQGVSDFMIDHVRLFIPEDSTVDVIRPAMVSYTAGNIYPNPSQGIINLPQTAIGGNLEIFDLQGRVRYSAPISASQVDVSKLEKGSYIVKIRTNKLCSTVKLQLD
ncbi:MAG: family 43 glycosylhydrolase [Bacteroidota bacterium]|nr:family 43 glycosylhydrolase [Bacteroidota bacterium]